MKNTLSLAALSLLALPFAANAQTVINFNDAFGDSFGNHSGVYVGQGAYADAAANTTWNAFSSSGVTSGPALTSSGAASTVTATVTYGFSNGGAFGSDQGHPQFLLGNALGVNASSGNSLGTLTIAGVAAGTYDLYLYGSNYDHDRGSLFTVGSGTADGGINATLNSQITSFVEGTNYVLFHNVTPTAAGTILATWAPNPADGVGNNNLSGEGSFNGFQLVSVPAPSALALLGLGGLVASKRRR